MSSSLLPVLFSLVELKWVPVVQIFSLSAMRVYISIYLCACVLTVGYTEDEKGANLQRLADSIQQQYANFQESERKQQSDLEATIAGFQQQIAHVRLRLDRKSTPHSMAQDEVAMTRCLRDQVKHFQTALDAWTKLETEQTDRMQAALNLLHTSWERLGSTRPVAFEELGEVLESFMFFLPSFLLSVALSSFWTSCFLPFACSCCAEKEDAREERSSHLFLLLMCSVNRISKTVVWKR